MKRDINNFNYTYAWNGTGTDMADTLPYAMLTATNVSNEATINLSPVYDEKLQEITDAIRDLIILSSNSSINEKIEKIEERLSKQENLMQEIANVIKRLDRVQENSNGQAYREDHSIKMPPNDLL
jgi:hypothetical protein